VGEAGYATWNHFSFRCQDDSSADLASRGEVELVLHPVGSDELHTRLGAALPEATFGIVSSRL
jgi:hypothetical protein